MLEPLPTGPYFYNVNHKIFNGEYLKPGVYQVVVIKSPQLENYFLCDEDNGRLVCANVVNYKMYITEEEIIYAYSLGYEIFLVDSWVCESKTDIFSGFVNKLYAERKDYKKAMKKCEEAGDESGMIMNDFLQNFTKTTLNSLYGKFGQNISQDISNYLTTNVDYILQLIQDGSIGHIEQLENNYFKFSATIEKNFSDTNFIIASYITARGRRLLHQYQTKIINLGYDIIYSDTDSLYFAANEKWTEEERNKQQDYLNKNIIDNVNLGGSKLEIADKISYPYSDDAIFVGLKMYALRSTHTGKELITCKGLPSWLCGGHDEEEKERNKQRRAQFDAKEITYKDFINLIENNVAITTSPIEVEQTQRKHLCDDGTEHLKEVRLQVKTIRGNITKGFAVQEVGSKISLIMPPRVKSNIDISLYELIEMTRTKSYSFETLEQAAEVLKLETVNKVLEYYYVFQQGFSGNYFIFPTFESIGDHIPEATEVLYGKENSKQNAQFHEVFGDVCPLMLDIDIDLIEPEKIQEGEEQNESLKNSPGFVMDLSNKIFKNVLESVKESEEVEKTYLI